MSDTHRITVQRLVVFLDGPHAHVVKRIQDGKRVVAPAAAAGTAWIGRRVVVCRRRTERHDAGCRRTGHGTQRVADQAADIGWRCADGRTGHGKTHDRMSLTSHRNGRNPVLACRSKGRSVVEYGARLHNRRRGGEVLEFVPATRVARRRSGVCDNSSAHPEVVRGPHATIADHGLVEAIVQRIQTAVGATSIAEMRHSIGGRRGRHGDADICRDRRSQRTGIADAPEHDRAERRIVWPDEIAFRRAGIQVVDAAW